MRMESARLWCVLGRSNAIELCSAKSWSAILIIAHAIKRANLICMTQVARGEPDNTVVSVPVAHCDHSGILVLEQRRLMHDYTSGVNRLQPSNTFIMWMITLYNGAIRTKNSKMTVRVAVYALAHADSTTVGPDQIIIETCRCIQAQLIMFVYWITE